LALGKDTAMSGPSSSKLCLELKGEGVDKRKVWGNETYKVGGQGFGPVCSARRGRRERDQNRFG